MSGRKSRLGHRIAVAAGVAVLVGFHLDLFLDRLLDGSVLQPVVAGEWLLSLGILWLFWRFRRGGVPIVRGRRALALWFVVLLLHAVAVVPDGEGAQQIAVDRDLLVGVPLGVVLGALVASTRRWQRRSVAEHSLDPFLWRVEHPPFSPLPRQAFFLLAPRAPPA